MPQNSQQITRAAFESLPLLYDGESKEVRLFTPFIVAAKLKPSVYSFTENRSGVAIGTEIVRARFTAAVFKYLRECDWKAGQSHESAFITLCETADGPWLIQRMVRTCNLEVRVKRYHIGSPVHRYKFTAVHDAVNCNAVTRWTRFDQPIVCFDWRNPMTDVDGTRLSDEPLSDDYAAVWMQDVQGAKVLARLTFVRLEELFASAGFVLVDICFFIGRDGRTMYGEISPDCMRIRSAGATLDAAGSFDKDVWRNGGSPDALLASYQSLYRAVFHLESK